VPTLVSPNVAIVNETLARRFFEVCFHQLRARR